MPDACFADGDCGCPGSRFDQCVQASDAAINKGRVHWVCNTEFGCNYDFTIHTVQGLFCYPHSRSPPAVCLPAGILCWELRSGASMGVC